MDVVYAREGNTSLSPRDHFHSTVLFPYVTPLNQQDVFKTSLMTLVVSPRASVPVPWTPLCTVARCWTCCCLRWLWLEYISPCSRVIAGAARLWRCVCQTNTQGRCVHDPVSGTPSALDSQAASDCCCRLFSFRRRSSLGGNCYYLKRHARLSIACCCLQIQKTYLRGNNTETFNFPEWTRS